MRDLPARLAHLRALAGLTQRGLAKLAGLTDSHVRLLEEGARKAPSVDTIAPLAEVLGVSLDWVVRGVGDAPTAADVCGAVERTRAKRGSGAEPPPDDDAAERTGTEG